jgi:putative membrane protein
MRVRNRFNMKTLLFGAVVLGAFLFLTGMFFAQPLPKQNGPAMKASDPAIGSDTTFARKAAQGGMAEVKMGRLAEEKGSSQDVKNFGKKMVEDHSAANEKLEGIASQQNITLPATLNRTDQATYDHLSKLSGDAFDRAYAKDMVQDHQQDIADFKTEARNGQNSAVKGFASNTLPTLEEHLKMARNMEQHVNGGQ